MIIRYFEKLICKARVEEVKYGLKGNDNKKFYRLI